METPRRMRSSSAGDSSPLPPPVPTPGRQLAHWPVQTPSEPLEFRPLNPVSGVTEPKLMPRPLPGQAARRRGDARRHPLALLGLVRVFKPSFPPPSFLPCPGVPMTH